MVKIMRGTALLAISLMACHAQAGTMSARLDSGLTLEFRLAHSSPGTGDGKDIHEVILARQDGVNRVLADPEHDRFFGYRITAERLGDGKVRIVVGALPMGFVEEFPSLHWERVCPGCERAVRMNGKTPEFPDPQVVDLGDSFFLELLENHTTGAKVVDVVTVLESGGLPPDEGPLSMTNARLFVNGQPMQNTASCQGHVIYFFTRGGRILVSAKPREGFDDVAFLRNNLIEVEVDGDHYEWISSLPVVTMPVGPGGRKGTQITMGLWVRYDTAWAAELAPGTYGVGVADERAYPVARSSHH